MAALTLSTQQIKDANGATVTINTASNGTHDSSAVAVLGNDGAHFLPSGDAAGREIFVILPTAGAGSQPTVTRPANTTAYLAGSIISGAITFTSAGPVSGGRAIINGADLVIKIGAIPSGMTSFTLYLYDVTPPSALTNGTTFDIPPGDVASYLGSIDFGTVVDIGSTVLTKPVTPNLPVKLNGSTSLFGYLVTNGAFTPAANSEVYLPRISVVGV